MRGVFLIFFLSIANPCVSAEYNVTSGEHKGFTRVVVDLDRRQEYDLEKVGNRLILKIDQHDAKYNLENAHYGIGKNRIREIYQKEPGSPLEIYTGCNCEVEDFFHGENFLVIDIKDRGGEEIYKAGSYNALLRYLRGKGRRLSNRKLVGDVHSSLRISNSLDVVKPLGDGGISNFEYGNGGNFSRSNNLIYPNIKIVAPFFGDDFLRRTESSEGENEEDCLKDSRLHFLRGANIDGKLTDRGRLRGEVVNEHGDLNLKAMDDLIEIYIFLGFNEEAGAILEVMPKKSKLHIDVLNVLQSIDSDVYGDHEGFQNQQHCSGWSSLLGLLADGFAGDNLNQHAVLNNFKSLPSHLQLYFGPRLISILSQSGSTDLAGGVRSAMNRTRAASFGGSEFLGEINGEKSPYYLDRETSRSLAELQIPFPRTPQYNSHLEALLESVDNAWHNRSAVASDQVFLLGAYMVEFSGFEVFREIKSAYSLSLALNGDFKNSFVDAAKYTSAGDLIFDEDMMKFFQLLTEQGSNSDFLKYAIPNLPQAGKVRRPERLYKLFKRVFELGFYHQLASLDPVGDGGSGDQGIRIFQAASAIEIGRPNLALLFLEDVKHPEALSLKTEAREKVQGYTFNDSGTGFDLVGDVTPAIAESSFDSQRRTAENLEDYRELLNSAVDTGALANDVLSMKVTH